MDFPVMIGMCATYLAIAYGHGASTKRVCGGDVYISVALNHRVPSYVCGVIAILMGVVLTKKEYGREAPLPLCRNLMATLVSSLFVMTTLVRMEMCRKSHKFCADGLIYTSTLYMLLVALTRGILFTSRMVPLLLCCLVWIFVSNRYDYWSCIMTLVVELVTLVNMMWIVVS